ncbi:MAG: hypothetical protein JNK25_11180 [Phycisphaerae bacterium]|nr:hypothetical protein [Phycisphaerae bacterium]
MNTNRRILVLLLSAVIAGCDSAPREQTSSKTSPSPAVKSAAPHTEHRAASPTVVDSLPEAKPLVLSSEPWAVDSAVGRVMTTPSYRLYTTSNKTYFTENMPPFLEAALTHYTSALGQLPQPREMLEVYLMDTRGQWESMTRRFMGEDAGVYLRIQKGGFTSGGRAILYDIGRRDTFAITAHEAWHVYTQRTFRNALPVWMEEGLACYMEGFRWDPSASDRPTFLPWANFERFDQLRWGVRAGKLMPLDRLVTSTPQDLIAEDANAALFYYAQVWALIHFLNEGEEGAYSPALRQLVADAAAGRLVQRIQKELGQRAANSYVYRKRGVDLLSLYFGKTPAAMQPEFDAYLERIVKTGTRQMIWQGKSPVAP